MAETLLEDELNKPTSKVFISSILISTSTCLLILWKIFLRKIVVSFYDIISSFFSRLYFEEDLFLGVKSLDVLFTAGERWLLRRMELPWLGVFGGKQLPEPSGFTCRN